MKDSYGNEVNKCDLVLFEADQDPERNSKLNEFPDMLEGETYTVEFMTDSVDLEGTIYCLSACGHSGRGRFLKTAKPKKTEKVQDSSESVGVKYDNGKVRWELFPSDGVPKPGSGVFPWPHTDILAKLETWFLRCPHSSIGSIVLTALTVAGFPEQQYHGGSEVVTRVLMFGAKKYADRNWEKGIKFSRLFASAKRHLIANARGEKLDPESGLPHIAHAACNIVMISAFVARGRTDLDDRPAHQSKIVWAATPRIYGATINADGIIREYRTRF